MTIINIEISPHNKLSEALHKICYKLEDIFFNLILFITSFWQPKFLMNWMDAYTTKRISQLQHEQVKNTWKTIGLEKAVEQIQSQQQD